MDGVDVACNLPRILDRVNATNASLRATWHAPERRGTAHEREPDDGRLRPHFDDAATGAYGVLDSEARAAAADDKRNREASTWYAAVLSMQMPRRGRRWSCAGRKCRPLLSFVRGKAICVSEGAVSCYCRALGA